MKDKRTVLYLSHGGGPLPLLGDEQHAEMVACLEEIAAKISRPSAILVISAHWETEIPTITSAANPPLIYDYHGFPEEAYAIEYPCSGEPALTKKVYDALEDAGMGARLDAQRGFDHGLFVPMKIMYPQADIPCVQLSLVKGLDPETHIEIGRSLQALDHEGLLIIGSGLSFHNIRAFFTPETNKTKGQNDAFEEWLLDTCSDRDIAEGERAQRFIAWSKAPSARYCHPREEHLLPLHVCYGVAGTYCSERFELRIMGKRTSMYLWSTRS